MSTRGLVGLRHKGVDWLQYNHSDSYPGCLGKEVVKQVLSLDADVARRYAEMLVAVDDEDAPTDAQLRELWPLLDVDERLEDALAESERRSFYSLYRRLQGELAEFVNRGIRFWPSAEGFLYSRSCEWVYLLNLDDEALEVYTSHYHVKADGEQYYPRMKLAGRYATAPKLDESDHPATLLASIPLAELRELPHFAVQQWLERIDRVF